MGSVLHYNTLSEMPKVEIWFFLYQFVSTFADKHASDGLLVSILVLEIYIQNIKFGSSGPTLKAYASVYEACGEYFKLLNRLFLMPSESVIIHMQKYAKVYEVQCNFSCNLSIHL